LLVECWKDENVQDIIVLEWVFFDLILFFSFGLGSGEYNLIETCSSWFFNENNRFL